MLQKVFLIRRHADEIAKANGEKFNIFEILRNISDETHVHSKFIAELLKPNGSHGMGALFLKLFLQIILPDFHCQQNELSKANVLTEYDLGIKNIDATEGGKVDIFLQIPQQMAIVIENKIYAEDQNNQLLRYSNYLKKLKDVKKKYLFYLNLHGSNPSEGSGVNELPNSVLHKLSYKEHILNWIEVCIKESASVPLLRETLRQYEVIVKKLTNMHLEGKMNEEICSSIRTDLISAYTIYSKFDNTIYSIFNEFALKLSEQITNLKLNVEYLNFESFAYVNNWQHIGIFYRAEHKKFKEDLCLAIQHYNQSWYIGIYIWNKDKINREIKNDSKIEFKQWPIFIPFDNLKLIGSEIKNLNEEELEYIQDFNFESQSKKAAEQIIKFITDNNLDTKKLESFIM